MTATAGGVKAEVSEAEATYQKQAVALAEKLDKLRKMIQEHIAEAEGGNEEGGSGATEKESAVKKEKEMTKKLVRALQGIK